MYGIFGHLVTKITKISTIVNVITQSRTFDKTGFLFHVLLVYNLNFHDASL